MSHRLLFVGGALLIGLSGCARDATSRVKEADKAAVAAEDERFQMEEAREDARESDTDAKKQAWRAQTAVKGERAKYREKLETEIAEANAKLAPPAGDSQPSEEKRTKLNQKRDVLKGHLDTLDQPDYKDWPIQKKKIDADLDRFD